jgi:hypothetical protein
VNTLSIAKREYEYEVNGVVQVHPHAQAEFLIDGNGLGTFFGFEQNRPWFGQTCFETPPVDCQDHLAALQGLRAPRNQFGTNRFVLYRCHCGCDYCGVISCEIRRDEGTVIWRDVRYEDDGDGDDEPVYKGVVPELVFAAEQYDLAIANYVTIAKSAQDPPSR